VRKGKERIQDEEEGGRGRERAGKPRGIQLQ